ncbi:MAG: hypothetical protein WC675_00345 [Patescibacteria group bacterium]
MRKSCFIGVKGDKIVKTSNYLLAEGVVRGEDTMEELRIKLKCPCCRANVYTTVSWPGPNLYFVQVTCEQCKGPFVRIIRNGRQPDLEETIWDYVVDPKAVESDLDEPEDEGRELTPWELLNEGLFEEGQPPINPEEAIGPQECAAIVAALGSLGHVPTNRELGIV